jgi:hypothetical protein
MRGFTSFVPFNLIALLLAAGMMSAAFPQTARASRAVVGVLGTGDAGLVLGGGSFFYEDQDNIFYNPSYVTQFHNFAIIEKSNFPGTTAEGGFYTSFLNYSFGAFFNRGDATRTAFANSTQMRPIELTVGADLTSWKVGLTYQHGGFNGTATPTVGGIPVTSETNDNVVRLGAQFGGLDPFVAWEFNGTDISAGVTNERKSVTAGARYHFGEWIPYAGYRYNSTNGTGDLSAFVVGVGRNARVAEGIRLNYALAGVRNATDSTTIVPIDLSAEAEALTWLVVRAGLSYRLLDRKGGTNNPDSTTGRIGATAHLAKSADLDWALGSGTNGRETSTSLDSQVFDVQGFFTAASLTYRW